MVWLCGALLVLGVVAGFLLAKYRYQAAPSPEQQLQLAAMIAESEAVNNQLSQLQQDKADLKYQLGEVQKSLNYAEQRVEKLKSQSS